jgi:hypothetical protein
MKATTTPRRPATLDALQEQIGKARELTSGDIAMRLDAILDEIAAVARRQDDLAARHDAEMIVVQQLLARVTDKSHVSKAEAAVMLSQRWHHVVSERTVKRMIERGLLTFERIPGTRQSGIPLRQVQSVEASYVSTRAQRTAKERHGK